MDPERVHELNLLRLLVTLPGRDSVLKIWLHAFQTLTRYFGSVPEEDLEEFGEQLDAKALGDPVSKRGS